MSDVVTFTLPTELLLRPLREARDVVEAHYLRAVLERFGGNVTHTAAFVGMERSALHRKMKQLDIGTTPQPSDDQEPLP